MSSIPSQTSEFEATSGENSSDEDGDGKRKKHGQGKARTVKARATLTPASMIDGALSEDDLQRKTGSKRRSNESHYDPVPGSARKRVHTNAYRELLNEQIRAVSTQTSSDDTGPLRPSQIGVTRWSRAEKEAFFMALSRRGRDDLPGIASAIGSKSESEVYVYLRLLRQGAVDKHLYEPRRQLLGPMELPAAVEVGPDCCDMLDRAAESLELEQRKYEEELEMARRGDDRWLLTPRVADWVAEKLGGEDEDVQDVEEILPAAALLKLEGWLELSNRIFMNAAPPQEDHNWRNIADQGEMPSIRYTAFDDFHALAVGFTRRLIQTTLFYAMSRLRSTDSRFFRPTPHVKPADVHTACRVLGVKLDSDDFWIGAARRCGLDVYPRMPTSGVQADKATQLDYGDVERQLTDLVRACSSGGTTSSTPFNRGDGDEDDESRLTAVASEESDSSSPSSSPSSTMYSQSSAGKLSPDPPLGSRHTPVDTSDDDVKHFYNRPERPDIVRPSRHALEQAQDEYAEAIDQQASREEEQRLWSMLHLQPPLHSVLKAAVVLEEKPRQERRTVEELVDWRERVEYRAQWEMMPRARVSEKAVRSSLPRAGTRPLKQMSDNGRKLSEDLPDDEHDDEDPVEVEQAASDVAMEDASGGSDQPDASSHGGQFDSDSADQPATTRREGQSDDSSDQPDITRRGDPSDNDSSSSSSPLHPRGQSDNDSSSLSPLGWAYRAAMGAMDKVRAPSPPPDRSTQDSARPVRTRRMPSSTGMVSTGSAVISEAEQEGEEHGEEREGDEDDDNDNEADDGPSGGNHAEPNKGAKVQAEESDDDDDDDDDDNADDEPSDSSSAEPDEGAQGRNGTTQAAMSTYRNVYDDFGDD